MALRWRRVGASNYMKRAHSAYGAMSPSVLGTDNEASESPSCDNGTVKRGCGGMFIGAPYLRPL